MQEGDGLRRVTGWLLVIGAVAFAVAATVLSSTFDWPDILREPPEVVLPAFVAGGTSLVWTWFAVAWTYAILLVPILLLPAALHRRDDPALRAATFVGRICSTRATSWRQPSPASRCSTSPGSSVARCGGCG
jgi:hypothetical protein